jgi:hypothetical protein
MVKAAGVCKNYRIDAAKIRPSRSLKIPTMTIQEMRELCDEIRQAIMVANDQGQHQRVQWLKYKKKQIKAKIQTLWTTKSENLH